MNRVARVVLVGAVVGIAAAAVIIHNAPAPTLVITAPTPPHLHVADLMDRGGCAGAVIGTQLFSYETGRCTVDGVEITVAVFTTEALRNQWLDAGQAFGGTFATGNGWAAGTTIPYAGAMTTFATAVGPT